MALCLILSSVSVVMATDEELENSTTTEIEQVEQVEEPATEETTQKSVQSSNEIEQEEEVDPSTTSEETTTEPDYYVWHSEDENGNAAMPKSLNLTTDLTEEDFETHQSNVVLQGYDETGNEIENSKQTIPIEKVERTITGDYKHPGWNTVVETLVYNDTYVETIYHGTYTFAVIYYLDMDTNEQIHTYNYELIGWSYFHSDQSPRQNAQEKTWDISEWDALVIDGYDYIKTIGTLAGFFSDLTQQHNVYAYYNKHKEEPVVPEEPKEPEEPDIPIVPPIQPENPISEEPVIINEPEVIIETGGLGEREGFSYIETSSIITSEVPLETEETPATINEEETPLTIAEGSWALINLIATICSVIIALILLFIKKKKENEEEEYTDKEKNDILLMRIIKILSIIFAIISIILFILTEDMTLPMELTDKWTFIMLILFIIEIINFFIVKTHSKQNSEE